MNKQPQNPKIMRSVDFATFGVPVVAYVKRIDLNGIRAYALHGADGEALGIEASEDLAALAARHKNLLPVLIQ
jgi:hypothetical protein